MNTQASLQQFAINAAKSQDWPAAISYNQEILNLNSQDLGALNRMGVAHLNSGNKKAAKKAFEQVLSIDKSNNIAKKHLSRLSNNQAVTIPTFSAEYFIEEPGKTKTVELHRLAGKNVLEKLSVGQNCELKLKNRFISVENDGAYIGALPEDLSFRLSNLLKTGNTYSCFVQSFTTNSCCVFLKERTRSQANTHTNSFPVTKNAGAAINELEDDFFLENNIPVMIGDEDVPDSIDVVEKSFEDGDTDER